MMMMMERREKSRNNVYFQRPTFLPLLCSRTDIKNVSIPLPAKTNQETTTTTSSSSLEQQKVDPLSPKISCIGQVKRSNKIVGFPTTTTSFSITPAAAHHRYFKLKRLFSGKNLTFSAPTTTTTTRTSRGGRIVKEVEFDNKRIDVAELDPPLPVVKKNQDGAAAAENLWKRRSGGAASQLPSLQIQPNAPHHLTVTTV